LFDRLVVVVPLASMCIRIGNLINSEIIGIPTDVPWAFIFIKESPLPRHPAQLYEAIFCFLLFIVMYWMWKNKRDVLKKGFMFGFLCVTFFTERFLVEFLKENQSDFESSLPINMGQILSIPFIVIGVYFIFRSKRQEVHAKRVSS
ncbi:MAG TPA: prolipoprotein diacylglyceryl transferase, partial [Bacteroidia bacterium]|nr:prolipoprotein diacylglyceryl transferase [Bacteroidia bacterium]